MELLYLWIENDGMTIKNQSFNFSNHINFIFSETDDNTGLLTLSENPNYIEDFFGGSLTLFEGDKAQKFNGGIVNVTGIIGENGVGKTNLLNFIIDLFTDRLPLGERFVIAFKDIENKAIKIFHTIEGYNINIDGGISNFIIEKPVLQTWNEIISIGNVFKKPKEFVNDFDLIFYSPVFDLRNYPPNISNDSRDYIDVSTNAIIENDVIKKGDFYPDDMDKLELHKFSNIRRQFELSFSNIAEISKVNIPKTINIVFHRNHFNPKEGQRNLTFDSEDIFNHLDKLVTEEFKKLNDIIQSYRQRNGEEKNFSYRNSIEYKKILAEKLKVEFTYSLIHNFFRNLSDHYNENIGIKLENIQGSNLFERTFYFFENQKWHSKRFGNVKCGLLYSSILGLIDEVDLVEYPIEDNVNYFTTDNTGGVTVLSNYETYITSIPYDHKKNFISFSWRNISSGENALLDLYARLLFAKKERLKPKEKADGKNKKFIYILIDEGELGFHPKWQSEYLFNLLNFITYCFAEYLVQVIVTSHSPFVVSDLPKNNLIFLEKNKENGECNVTSLGQQETFASNIHTLFSDQFFMKDSVIGKYAQTKLHDELEPLLNKNKQQLDIVRLKKIINTIGDPFIKEKLIDILNFKSGINV